MVRLEVIFSNSTVGLVYNRKMFGIVSWLRRWGSAILIMIVIFCFSSIPSKAMPNFGLIDFLVKKGGHALGFGLLALSYYYGYTGNWFEWKPLRAISALILAALFAVTDEYHQSFVPGRQPSVTDIMIDVVGSGVALIAAMWCIRKK